MLILIDWTLREQTSEVQPMPGGIPEILDTFVSWLSIVGFLVCSLMFQPYRWPWWIKFPAGVTHTVIAFGLLLYARIHYIIGNGIDTL